MFTPENKSGHVKITRMWFVSLLQSSTEGLYRVARGMWDLNSEQFSAGPCANVSKHKQQCETWRGCSYYTGVQHCPHTLSVDSYIYIHIFIFIFICMNSYITHIFLFSVIASKRFQRTVLDLTLQWRFSSLPNNAKLEMVPSARLQGVADSQVSFKKRRERACVWGRCYSARVGFERVWVMISHNVAFWRYLYLRFK